MVKKYRKQLTTLLKFALSFLGLWVVYIKVDVAGLLNIFRQMNPWPVLLALMFFIVSKAISAIRLRLLFRQIDIPISQFINFKLYLLGMFYNLFLPGGIGGDGYKIFVLNKHYQVPARKIFSAILLDRLSGIFILMLLAGLLISASGQMHKGILIPLIAIPILIVGFYVFIRFLFPVYVALFIKMNFLSLGVQLAQLVSAVFILMGLGHRQGFLPYLFLFLLSSVVTIIPITIGGAGARELAFLYGAQWFGADVELSVALSFTFYLITLITSLSGIYFIFKEIKFKPQS